MGSTIAGESILGLSLTTLFGILLIKEGVCRSSLLRLSPLVTKSKTWTRVIPIEVLACLNDDALRTVSK